MQVEKNCCNHSSKKNIDTKDYDNKDDFPESLLKSLHDVIKKEEYARYNMKTRLISTVGGNYLSVLYEADIKGRTAKEEKETNIFIKYMIPGEQSIFSVSDVYLKEKFAYSDMFKVFAELQEIAKVPDRERFKTVKYYPSGPEAVMLDNLTKKGFTTQYRMEGISLQFAELAMKELAKFHGLSFVIQELKPDYYKQKVMVLDQPFKFCEDWKTFYTNMLNQTSSNLSDVHKKKLKLLLPDFIKKFPKYLTDKEPVGSVVCHGDYRPNNMLMKESNGIVTEIIPVDFQTIYYGCPINDFIYFIITGTDRKLRKNHLNDLKNLYYQYLDKFVSYFDLDIEALYPRKEFERQYLERLDYGLMVSMYVLPFIFASEDAVPDVGKGNVTNLKFTLDKRSKERIEGVLEDYEEWGIF